MAHDIHEDRRPWATLSGTTEYVRQWFEADGIRYERGWTGTQDEPLHFTSPDGRVRCGTCQGDSFRIDMPEDEYEVGATCTGCGLRAVVYSG